MLLPLMDTQGPTIDWPLTGSLPSGMTFTRTQAADGTVTAFDASGSLAYYNANQPRFDYDPVTHEPLGLLIEGQRQNLLRNNTNVGGVAGSPGTLPTNWGIYTSGTGLTCTLSYGTEFGMPYVDIRLTGTPVGANDYSVFFEHGLAIPAVQNEVFTVSLLMRISAGSLSNISAISVRADENNSSGVYLSGGGANVTVSEALPSSPQYYTRTISNATAAYLRPRVLVQGTVGQPQDITIRIYLPQVEKAPSASSRILTSGVAVTRAADVLYTTGIQWVNPTQGTFVVDVMLDSFTGSPAIFGTNTIANIWSVTAASDKKLSSWNNVSLIKTANVFSTTQTHSCAFRYNGANRALVLDGGDVVESATAPWPSTPTGLMLGQYNNTQYLYGHIKSFKYYNRALSAPELQRVTI